MIYCAQSFELEFMPTINRYVGDVLEEIGQRCVEQLLSEWQMTRNRHTSNNHLLMMVAHYTTHATYLCYLINYTRSSHKLLCQEFIYKCD